MTASLLPYAAYRRGLAAVVARRACRAAARIAGDDRGLRRRRGGHLGGRSRGRRARRGPPHDRHRQAVGSRCSAAATTPASCEVAPDLGIALSTDGVGSKIVVAEQADRLETVGIDCVAMNVNDVICVGAEPIAMLDYLAVEQADPAALARIADGPEGRRGGGRTSRSPEASWRSSRSCSAATPSPHGFDLCGTAIGNRGARRDGHRRGRLGPATRSSACPPPACTPTASPSPAAPAGDAGLALDGARPSWVAPAIADALLEPTVIYVRAVLDLLRSAGPRSTAWRTSPAAA